MAISRFLSVLLLLWIIVGCSSTMSDEDFKKYLANPENGLSKEMVYRNSIYKMKVIPTGIDVRKMGESNPIDILCFEIKSVDTEGIFSLSEQNFKIIANGSNEYYPTIVFAENYGSEYRNRLIAAFSDIITDKLDSISCVFVDHGGEKIGALNIKGEQLERIKNIRRQL